MEDFLIKVGELVFTEFDEVEDIKYVDKQLGYMFILEMKGGDRVLVSLTKM